MQVYFWRLAVLFDSNILRNISKLTRTSLTPIEKHPRVVPGLWPMEVSMDAGVIAGFKEAVMI